jgi:hypothetical protein
MRCRRAFADAGEQVAHPADFLGLAAGLSVMRSALRPGLGRAPPAPGQWLPDMLGEAREVLRRVDEAAHEARLLCKGAELVRQRSAMHGVMR